MDNQQGHADSEARYRKVFNNAQDGIVITDSFGNIVDTNPANCAMHGYEFKHELIGKPITSLIHANCQQILADLEQRIESNEVTSFQECVNVQKNGALFPTEISVVELPNHNSHARLYIIHNLIYRKSAELAHMHRLTMLGQTATTLVHELSQPVAAIINYLRGSIRRLDQANEGEQKIAEVLEAAVGQAERASEIIKRMRNFVRFGRIQLSQNNINELVQKAISYLRPEIQTAGVKINLDLADTLPILSVDRLQLEQVIINLTKNAIEAVSSCEPNKRIITIKTELKAHKFIEISVCDNGPGLSQEILTKVFEPFVTTKETGIGMGLAISRTIIEAHSGSLRFETGHGKTTCFIVAFPIAK